MTAARLVGAAILGYAVIVALTTLGFVTWLDNADLYRGGPLLQIQGAVVAVVSGLVGGAASALIGGRRPLLHAAAVLPLLAADTLYVLLVFPRTAPAWFDLAGGLTLMAATLAGGWAIDRSRR